MREIPKLYWDRDITFDEDTLEKILYLGKVTIASTMWCTVVKAISDICNKALKEFFEIEFKKLKIDHFFNPKHEADIIRREEREKERFQEEDDRRLLALAKSRIIFKEIEKIKEEEARTGKNWK